MSLEIFDCEQWRPVVGFEGWYEVSNRGNVRTVAARVTNRKRKARVRPKVYRRTGHLAVRLCVQAKHYWRFVHRLVLEAFVGPCPRGMQCAHNNGDPQDNRIANLRWDTVKGNAADRKRHGTERVGSLNGNSKLTEADVRQIRQLNRQGLILKDIAARFETTPQNVFFIVTGTTWRHVA